MPVKCEICGEEFKTSQGLSSHLRNKHKKDLEKESDEASEVSNLHSELFKLYDRGGKPVDAVKKGLCGPDEAGRSWTKYWELKEGEDFEHRLDELESKVNGMEELIFERDPSLKDLIMSISDMHENWRKGCKHYTNGFCRRVFEQEEPRGLPYVEAAIKERTSEGEIWWIKPRPWFCFLCSNREQRTTRDRGTFVPLNWIRRTSRAT